ncbi:hypothetical protein Peur_011519 [Populus x canadensis]
MFESSGTAKCISEGIMKSQKLLRHPPAYCGGKMDIILATVDNPSNACEWAFAEVLNSPEILKMLVEELDRVVGKQQLVQESDFALLNYVEVCAREAFRLHPVAPLNIPRVSVADTVVSNHFIPQGSYAILSRLGTLKVGTSH